MAKKRLSATSNIIVILISSIVAVQLVGLATANPLTETRYDSPPILSINSPANETCSNRALVNITVERPAGWLPIGHTINGVSQKLTSIYFHVDSKFYKHVDANNNLSSPFSYSLPLANLADGAHTLVVSADSIGGFIWRSYGLRFQSVPIDSAIATLQFTVDSTSPNITILSKQATVQVSEFPLNFTVNESFSKLSFVLDGQKNVTVAGNTTLSGLPVGAHNVTVYAWDNAGNVGASETIVFTVDESTPVVPIAVASSASVAIVCVGLLAYLKRSKKPYKGHVNESRHENKGAITK